MTSTNEEVREQFSPPSNLPPGGTLPGQVRFVFRRLADLQVASVLQHLRPWLAGLSGSVLEVGCGAQPYRHMVPGHCRYQGLEWEGTERHFAYKPSDTVYYDGGAFPFPDASFDHLFATEVLEHVYDTATFLRECRRVIAPGGSMLLTVPFSARYHYIPFDFWRFTPAALERRLSEAGFTEFQIVPRGSDLTLAAHKPLSVVFRWLRGGILQKAMGLAAAPLALAALALGHLTLHARLGSSDDCLGYVVIVRRTP